MHIVAVDLAAKYSAACHMDLDGRVREQLDSWGRTETQFIDILTAPWIHADAPDCLLIEDLPHRVPYMTTTKNVCRLQGRILERMDYYGAADVVGFVQPSTWRSTFPGLENGTGPKAVVAVSEGLGYTPPDLSHRIIVRGDKTIAKKVATDYCAAYLIARWMVERYRELSTFDAPGITRHVTKDQPRI